jgi:hypothetical protein
VRIPRRKGHSIQRVVLVLVGEATCVASTETFELA